MPASEPLTPPPLTYHVSRAELGPLLGPRVVELGQDEATSRWLSDFGARPHGAVTAATLGLLARFASVYDVHGWLGVYQMHLLSTAQLALLLGAGSARSLLDVGAGAGYVTEQARPLFSEIVCTETSRGLRRRLHQRGFEVHATDLAAARIDRTFDVVACLNVLDRTARPLSLLAALVRQLAPGGKLLLSLPLPVSAHVQVAGGTVSARERLPDSARSFEHAARELTEVVLASAGLDVLSFSRAPYLSRGDGGAPYYVLDAGVWVLAAHSRGARDAAAPGGHHAGA